MFVAIFLPRLKLVAVPLGLLAGEALACYHFVIADACTLTSTPYCKFATRVWFTVAFVTTLTLTMSAIAHRLPIVFVPLRVAVAGTVSVITATVGVWKLLLLEPERQLLAERFTRYAPCSLAISIGQQAPKP